jgi:hypothetical protein
MHRCHLLLLILSTAVLLSSRLPGFAVLPNHLLNLRSDFLSRTSRKLLQIACVVSSSLICILHTHGIAPDINLLSFAQFYHLIAIGILYLKVSMKIKFNFVFQHINMSTPEINGICSLVKNLISFFQVHLSC